ncbi:cytochrome P450 [Sphingobium sp. YR768]|uniref:cytochrome P450 n=1 Tax=Sphingobium sp. YR768 TaxID=1884365 RepID=UPI0008B00579|nr:cytochrome P450 [Sphingobium sp. YR768]SER69570.1 Cytochrome P450 [Sphingobium sp. YR768]
MTQTIEAPAPLSFADPAVQRCPFSSYAGLRDEQPVYVDPLTGHYVLTRYEDIRKALLNVKVLRNRTGLNATRNDAAANAVYEEKGWLPIDTLVSNDPPDHRTYRTLVDKVFTPARVVALEPRIEEIIEELIDGFIDQDEIDFLQAFAVRLPMYVIAEQLGVPRSDMDRFKLWSDVSVESVSPVLTSQREVEIAELLTDMQRYLAAEIERVRETPNETLISHLANTETDGRLLDMRELLSIIHQLLVAGNETTTTTLASGMKLMIEQPALAEAIFADPTRAKPFVEETLRLLSPVQTLFRRVAEDIEIAGMAIPAGALVEVRYGAANRDPRQYAVPDEIDLDRKNASSHLAFGAGPHLCIGNQLARGELRLAIQHLTRRLTSMRATRGEDSYRWMTSYIAHGPDQLWMAFDKRG